MTANDLGRRGALGACYELVERYITAVAGGDVHALDELLTVDCVVETTEGLFYGRDDAYGWMAAAIRTTTNGVGPSPADVESTLQIRFPAAGQALVSGRVGGESHGALAEWGNFTGDVVVDGGIARYCYLYVGDPSSAVL